MPLQEMSSRGPQRFDLLFEEGSAGNGSGEGDGEGGGEGGGDASIKTIFSLARCGPWMGIIRAALAGRLESEEEERGRCGPSGDGEERGSGLRCQVSVVYSRPGADAQDWHSDGSHIAASSGWGGGWGDKRLSPYALCVFVPLVDLDQCIGFTQFWPGTHLHPKLAGFGASAPILGCR